MKRVLEIGGLAQAAGLALACLGLLVPLAAQDGPLTGFVTKLGIDIDVRTGTRLLSDDLAANVILPELETPVSGIPAVPQIQLRGGNVQVNDPATDYIQVFTGFQPFVHATQSETSTAAFGRNIVVGYNDTAGFHVRSNAPSPGVSVDRVLLSGFATSNDGGQTWKSGFLPPAAHGSETFGDPSVGVDRHGVFFYATFGEEVISVGGHPTDVGTVQVNKSTDGGLTWGPGIIVQDDSGSDKEWLAVGPDPIVKSRDDVYVTWTSFQANGSCQLRLGRSLDGGDTWTAKTIFSPTADPNPAKPQNCLQSSNPTVDQVTGTLYVPFLRFSNADQDFLQLLISDDAGETFHFAALNPTGPIPTALPVTQPGTLTECGGFNFRLTIHGSANPGPGKFGLPRFINASRLVLQPTIAARDGRLYLAWNNSTSLFFGDPNSHSNILFLRSDDGGNTWTGPIVVNPLVATDTQHVLPSLAIDRDPNDVHITYYTQHSNGSVDVDMANSHDGGASFPVDRTVRVTSTSFDLPPTNIPTSGAPSFNAINYDRLIQQCYALGEYQSVTTANGNVYAAWGDARNSIVEPVNALDPISGQTHPQEDVRFQEVKAQ